MRDLPRRIDAVPSPSGYLIDLYCCRVDCYSTGEATAEGPKSYFEARKIARLRGWILHRDGYATCPNCAKKMKTQNQ